MSLIHIFQSGSIIFYSLETQCVVGETKVGEEIVDLQICFDDSLDLLALLVSTLIIQVFIFIDSICIENLAVYLCILIRGPGIEY